MRRVVDCGWLLLFSLALHSSLGVSAGCRPESVPPSGAEPSANTVPSYDVEPIFAPEEFAKKSLAQSYAAKAELGEISEVALVESEGVRHVLSVTGSIQNAKMTMLSATPGGEPSATLHLDDGRQVPMFIDFLEESYKSDLGIE